MIAQNGMSSAIVGTQNAKHFVENIKSVDIVLTEDEIADLGSVNSGHAFR